MSVEWSTIEAGDLGIGQTLARMRALTLSAAQEPAIVQTARMAVADVNGHDREATAAALFNWFTRHYVYTLDPTGYELLVSPLTMLRHAASTGYLQGDCDDAVMLLAALLESVGVRTRFRVVAQSTPLPRDAGYSHVFVEAETEPGQWLPLDVTLDGAAPGDRPPAQPSEALYDASGFHVETPAMIRRLGRFGQFESDFGITPGVQADVPYVPASVDFPVPTVYSSSDIDSGSGYPGWPVTTQMPSAGASGAADWGKIFGDVTGAVVKIGASALPLLERYGTLTPMPGSVPLQYPGETSQQYAARVAAGGFGRVFATTPTSTWLLLGGGALLLVMLMRGRK